MPISISCQCRRSYTINDEFARETVKCSNCGAIFQIGLLYLAEVIKKRFSFGGKTALKLLAYQQSAQNWQALQGDEVIPAKEANRFSHGSLVLVRLNDSRQIQQIENQTGQKLAQVLRQFSLRYSRLLNKYQASEEDVEEWKKSLTFSRKSMKTGQRGEVVRFLTHQFEEAFSKAEKPWVALPGYVGVRIRQRPFWDNYRIPAITILPLTQWKALHELEAIIELHEQPPTLVVEVVSDSTETDDCYNLRASAWALLKIPECWIVNLLQKEVTLYILEDQTYTVITYQGDELVQSSIMPSLHLSVSQIMSV
ncbi:Uma2 family endonuclease [Tumidithrix elongata RA019]|uniref:Uma2 family endonuclease n=1 Tax=Tumidithrix elongata BACA0141 TaxID=2716417 RepID=A0AAW9PTM8_9CYAN|nr:Uma2 family endonuclease [Tumidithrix elongata RA019]